MGVETDFTVDDAFEPEPALNPSNDLDALVWLFAGADFTVDDAFEPEPALKPREVMRLLGDDEDLPSAAAS